MGKILLLIISVPLLLFVGAIVIVGIYDGFRGVNRFDHSHDSPESSIKDIESMSGIDFEIYCANVLKRNNFLGIELTKTTGDQGVDIIANRDGKRYAFQCKKYSSSVGNKAVQEVIAGMNYYSCDIGVVITNSYFTKSVIDLANKTGIILLNGSALKKFESNMLL